MQRATGDGNADVHVHARTLARITRLQSRSSPASSSRSPSRPRWAPRSLRAGRFRLCARTSPRGSMEVRALPSAWGRWTYRARTCMRACLHNTCMHTHAYMDARRVLSRGGNRALRTQAQAPPEPKGVEAQDEARRAHRPAPGGLLRPAQLQVARGRVPVRRCPAAGIVVRAPSSLHPSGLPGGCMPSVPATVRGLPTTRLLCTLLVAHSHVWRRAVCEAQVLFAVASASQPCSPVGLEAAPRKTQRLRLRNRPQRRPVPR